MKPVPPSYFRTLSRLTKAAERESQALIKSLPKELRERIKGIPIRFEDKPSPSMIAAGMSDEAISATSRDGKEVVIFLMNLFERHGKRPGAFNEELRAVLMRKLAEMTGAEWTGVEPQ